MESLEQQHVRWSWAQWIACGDSALQFFSVHGHSRLQAPRAGALSCWPPDESLPDDALLVASAGWQLYDGTLSHAAKLAPGFVNLTDAATPLMGTSERKTLWLAVNEEVAALRRAVVFEDGALDDVSCLVLPMRGIRFARLPPGALPGGFEVGPPEGMLAHSKRVYAAQWDGDRLRKTELCPRIPLPEDSLSSMGAAAVALDLAQQHCQESPGFYNRLRGEGDGERAFSQGDVGTEKVNLGNLLRL